MHMLGMNRNEGLALTNKTIILPPNGLESFTHYRYPSRISFPGSKRAPPCPIDFRIEWNTFSTSLVRKKYICFSKRKGNRKGHAEKDMKRKDMTRKDAKGMPKT